MGRIFFASLAAILYCLNFAPPALASDPPTFTRHTISDNLRGAYWVYAKDVDGDGNRDLVTAAFDGIDWWQNDGANNFTRNSVGPLIGAWTAHAADVDGDGDIDMLGGTPSGDELVLWKNDGAGGYPNKIIIDSNGLDPETVLTADIDGDGDTDIISAHWKDGHINWYENTGTAFQKHTVDSNMKGAHSVAAADLDGDGDLDMLGGGSSVTRWYVNDGAANFTKQSLNDFGALCLYPADLDNDGDLDFLRTQRDNGDLDWFENDGSGTFVERTIEAQFSDSWSVRAGDMDGDGDLDVAAAGFSANNIKVWINDGLGNFGTGIVIDDVDTPRFVHVEDLDNDGDADVAAAIRDARDLVWYEVLGAPLGLSLTSPAPGDTVMSEQNFPVEWTTAGAINNVGLAFSADGGVSWSDITNSAPNTGMFNWSVPDTSSQQCLLRVYGLEAGEPADTTSGVFTIQRPGEEPQTIAVLSPNGLEQIAVGSVFPINWSFSGNIPFVNIEFSTDSGQSWNTLAMAAENAGGFDWTVPKLPSQACLIKVSDAADGQRMDVSDTVFSIFELPQSLEIMQPNGNELLVEGRNYEIQWSSSGGIDSVNIEFSSNGGLLWDEVAYAISNLDSFNWTVPGIYSAFCLIRISDAEDGEPVASSASNFTVRTVESLIPIISSFEPRQGEPGTSVTIRGSNFLEITEVILGKKSTVFSVEAEDRITAVVPLGAASDNFIVTNFAGTGESDEIFQIVAGIDTVTSFFFSTDDAQVKVADSTRNYGDKPSFKIENGKFLSYLKFDVSGFSGAAHQAILQLEVLNGSNSGGNIFGVSNTYKDSQTLWDEAGLSFANAPTVGGFPVDTVGAVAIGDTVAFDVTALITGDGVYSFALRSKSSDQVDYSSKEGVTSPRLMVVGPAIGNLSPYAEDDRFGLHEDVSTQLNVLDNDADSDGTIAVESVAIVTGPSHGQATVGAGGSLIFLPAENFFGQDSLFYTVLDDKGAISNVSRVFLEVLSINDAPVAVLDVDTLRQGHTIQISVLQNDADIDGQLDSSSVEIVSGPFGNAAAIVTGAAGTINYTPDVRFSGRDSLFYTVKDDSGSVSNQGKILIWIITENQPPLAVDDIVQLELDSTVDINVLANDLDPEEMLDVTTVSVHDTPQNGELFVHVLTGEISYAPFAGYIGLDSLTYTVQDTGGLVSNPATVRIVVREENQPPVIETSSPLERTLAISQDGLVNFSINVSDGNSDTLAFNWRIVDPVSFTDRLVSTTTEYQFNAMEWLPANYTVNVTVSDGLAADSLAWQLDIVTSVEMATLSAGFVAFAGNIIQWDTSRETYNAGFNVLRSHLIDGEYVRINKELLSSNQSGTYQFIDKDVQTGRRYHYLIEGVNINGRQAKHGPLSVLVSAPEQFELSPNYPNPFNPSTRIRFQLPTTADVSLIVYNVMGREVRTLVHERKPAGYYDVTWEGNDNNGRPVSTGIYYYRIVAADFKETRRMAFLK